MPTGAWRPRTRDSARRGDRRASAAASGSTPSSCRRAATARCCAWSRSPSTTPTLRTAPRIILIDALDDADARRSPELLADPGDRDRPPRRPTGRGDPPPRVEHRDDEHLRHPARGRVRRRQRAGRLRQPARLDPRSPGRQDRELHALGCAAADRASSSATPPRTSPTCSSSPTSCSGGSRAGRLEWAREECRRLESATDERDPETAWERLPRVGQLDPRARAVARELAAWRERTAAARGPAGRLGARRPAAGRAGQASALRPRARSSRSAASTLRHPPSRRGASSRRSPADARRRRSPARSRADAPSPAMRR